MDVEGGLRSRVLLENNFLPACARQAAAQAVCGACGSPGLTCTVAEQAEGMQDRFVETTHVPEPPIHSITPLLWPPTPGRSFPVTPQPCGVLEAPSCSPAQPTGSVCAKPFSSSAHGQCLCKAPLVWDGKCGDWHRLSALEGPPRTGGLSFLDVGAADIPPNIPPGKGLGGGGRDEIRLSMNFP